ncbi:MAG TPA: DinB family protein [Chitinophagaceae bacterium]|nr:DinB family protein [Chitinophagaceae bacterium]
MQFTQYLLDTFRFNDKANRQMIEKIKQLPDKEAAVKYMSHLANSQYKWMARIIQDPKAPQMDWWKPLYKLEELETEWEKSLQLWINYLENKTDEEISREVTFVGFDGGMYAATPKDIMLQLNYHSIHHRAQIQIIIRQQGLEPDFIDYIGTVYRKLS